MKIVTFNAGLLSISLFGGLKKVEPAGGVLERLQRMPEILSQCGADILVMQEIYSLGHKVRLAQALKGVLPYAAFSQKDPWLRLLPDSLMTLSKYPIANPHFVRFTSGRWDERLLDTKGFLVADLPDTPLGPVRVTNVHTTAGVFTHPEHPTIDAVRHAQITQLVGYSRQSLGVAKLILAGDFNFGPAVPSCPDQPIRPLVFKDKTIPANERVSARNYQLPGEMGFTDTYLSLGLPEQPTWTPTGNPLNSGGSHASWGCPAQRIDHIYIQKSDNLLASDGNVFLTESVVPLPDGSVVPLSDHYGYWASLVAR